MSKGDTLARGGQTASFSAAGSDSELTSDLKIQTAAYVTAKYGISREIYDDLVSKLAVGEALPDLPTAFRKTMDAIDDDLLCEPIQPFEDILPEEVKQKVGYKGKPLGDQVLLSRVDREHTSNLIIPDSLKGKSDIAYVTAIGKEVKRIEPGWLVLVDKFATHGSDCELVDEDGITRKYLLVHEYDIWMRLEKIILE